MFFWDYKFLWLLCFTVQVFICSRVVIVRLWVVASFFICWMLALFPFLSRISQITTACIAFAFLARKIAASVWPNLFL